MARLRLAITGEKNSLEVCSRDVGDADGGDLLALGHAGLFSSILARKLSIGVGTQFRLGAGLSRFHLLEQFARPADGAVALQSQTKKMAVSAEEGGLPNSRHTLPAGFLRDFSAAPKIAKTRINGVARGRQRVPIRRAGVARVHSV